MKKLVLAGLLALTALGMSAGNASAFYPCYDVYQPCWQIPLPKFPLVIPSIKFYCADCCPPKHNANFSQPWYMYYPPNTYTGYNSPWHSYAPPAAYPHAAAPAQGAGQAAQPQYAPQGNYAGHDYASQGGYAAPSYWYGR